jgi:hypothetical protein
VDELVDWVREQPGEVREIITEAAPATHPSLREELIPPGNGIHTDVGELVDWFRERWNELAAETDINVKPIQPHHTQEYRTYWQRSGIKSMETVLLILDGLYACPFWLGTAPNYESRGLHWKTLFQTLKGDSQPIWQLLQSRAKWSYTDPLQERVDRALRTSGPYTLEAKLRMHGVKQHELEVAKQIAARRPQPRQDDDKYHPPTKKELLAQIQKCMGKLLSKPVQDKDGNAVSPWRDWVLGLETLWEVFMRTDVDTPLTPAALTRLDGLICKSFLNHPERSKEPHVQWAAGRLHLLLEELTATAPVILSINQANATSPSPPATVQRGIAAAE